MQLQRKEKGVKESTSRTGKVDRRAGKEGVEGAEIVGYAVRGRCGRGFAITRRAGEDDDGDRDSALVERVYPRD